MEQYKNIDGTYTSPKNGKVFKSEKALRAHLSFRRTENSFNLTTVAQCKMNCAFCKKEVSKLNISVHSKACYLNPVNLTKCIVCDTPIKNFKQSKGTCSRRCANKHFRSGEDNGNWKGTQYVTICFSEHKKECVVCGENKIVAVHHLNENHNDNRIENLVPLCPTHHQYMHSRYKAEILPIVEEYVKQFILRFA